MAIVWVVLVLLGWAGIGWLLRRAIRRAEYHEAILDRLIQIHQIGKGG